MNVYVDDQQIGIDDMPDATVGQVVERIRQTASNRQQVIVELRCDGLDVTGPDLNEMLARPSCQVERLDVQTGSPSTLVIDALDQAVAVLDQAGSALAAIVDDLNAGRTGDGMNKLAEAFRDWLMVHDAIGKSLAMLNLDADKLTVEGQSATQAILAPRDLLLQIREVVQNRDHVQLADILQYEFDNAIRTWRTLVQAILGEARGGQ